MIDYYIKETITSATGMTSKVSVEAELPFTPILILFSLPRLFLGRCIIFEPFLTTHMLSAVV